MEGFDRNNPTPVKGFEGLKLLISDTDEVGKAFIRVMEFLHSGHIDLKTDYHKLCSCLHTLSEDLQYSAAELKSFIIACLLTFRHFGFLIATNRTRKAHEGDL
eukprot:CCRYP_014959-RA/>CCRYP_014959-RA protein AED:0.41 eAED:0.41 QI:2/1/1/1/0/0/2/7/102